MEKIWKVAERKFDNLIEQVLFNRGIIQSEKDKKAEESFFDPDFLRDLHSPFLMSGIQEAVDLIVDSKKKEEKIGIFSDYDADGIPGAALMYRALKKIGMKPEVYIPNRESGYGLSAEGIDDLKNKGCTLIITIDLGIKSVNEAIYCKKNGIKLIITDHHLPDDNLPQPDVLINPKVPGDKYPYKELCGCGVAYKLIQGLASKLPELDERFLKWNLDLVAISTIADVVPITGENRVIAYYGLKVLKKTRNLGISELIKVAKLNQEQLTSYQVGFQIAPRINAPGRMDYATKSLELLVTETPEEAKELAESLDHTNETRQKTMDEAEKEIVNLIEMKKLFSKKIIVVSGDWKKGVIGPTASRIVEKYYKPTILLAKDGDQLVGSARSISGVNIIDILSEASSALVKFGGHKGAAGLTLNKDSLKKFEKLIEIAAEKKIRDSDLNKVINIDAAVELHELNIKLFEKINKFEPFGMGNAKPVFLLSDFELKNYRFVGKEEKHLSFMADKNGNAVKSICFNFPIDRATVACHKKYDAVFALDINEWQGARNLNLNIVDIREHLES